MKKHIAQVRSATLIPYKPLLARQLAIQNLQDVPERFKRHGARGGVGIYERVVENVLVHGALGCGLEL